MATRQQLTDAIDKGILQLLNSMAQVDPMWDTVDAERACNAVSALVYARADLIRTDYEVTKLEQMKGRVP